MFVALKRGKVGLLLPFSQVSCLELQLTFKGTFLVPCFVCVAPDSFRVCLARGR